MSKLTEFTLCSHYETEYRLVNAHIKMTVMPLHHVKIWCISVQYLWSLKWQNLKIVPRLGHSLTIVLHSAHSHDKTDCNVVSQFRFQHVNLCHIKFGEISFSDPEV